MKIKLIRGLRSLSKPFGSIIDASRNRIETIGAISELPGSMNQKDPKTPINRGVKKYLKNLLEIIFMKR